MFNSDKSRIIICNIASGGCGISLHDTHGIFQRISLISPSWSVRDIIQVIGRIHRAMAKSDANNIYYFVHKHLKTKYTQFYNKNK